MSIRRLRSTCGESYIVPSSSRNIQRRVTFEARSRDIITATTRFLTVVATIGVHADVLHKAARLPSLSFHRSNIRVGTFLIASWSYSTSSFSRGANEHFSNWILGITENRRSCSCSMCIFVRGKVQRCGNSIERFLLNWIHGTCCAEDFNEACWII